MKRTGLRAGLAAAAAFGLMLAGSATASASVSEQTESGGGTVYTFFKLTELNDTGAYGFGSLLLHGNQASVRVFAHGLVPGKPHAQHFHINGAGRCPTPADDANGDGVVSTAEGKPDYGAIGASLTTRGDTSPASGLAVKRFPTADYGFVSYQRTFQVSDDVAQDIRTGNAVLVLHGIDTNGNGTYDFSAGKSALNPALPLEATAPAACGGQTLRVGAEAMDGLNLDLGLELGLDLGL